MAATDKPVLGLVVPCYNEQRILPESAASMRTALQALIDRELVSADSRIYFVDDGSEDATWAVICELAGQDRIYAGLKLTRNYGHQFALYAGLMEAEGDALVSLDADLQDDIGVLEDMLVCFLSGNEIVYGIRQDRQSDSLFKRWTAEAHYWLSARMGIETVRNHADYRLMSRRAVEFLGQYREAHLYLRGIVPQLGLPSAKVYYKREKRRAGESKYPLRKMLSLSLQGLTSFSVVPLRLIAVLGLVVFCVSMLMGGWALLAVLSGRGVVPGWASTVIPIYLLGGLQLLAIGIAGEYVGKTFIEAKKRPLYQIEQRCGAAAD